MSFIDQMDNKPKLGNLVLALIFGGIMIGVTLFIFKGSPQLSLFLGICSIGMVGIFFAGSAYDKAKDQECLRRRDDGKRRRSKLEPFD